MRKPITFCCEESAKLDQELCLVKLSRWKGNGKGGMGHRNIAFS
jgi:hypothetical protein